MADISPGSQQKANLVYDQAKTTIIEEIDQAEKELSFLNSVYLQKAPYLIKNKEVK